MLIVDPYLFNRDAANGETEEQQIDRVIRQLKLIEAIRLRTNWEVVVQAALWQKIESKLISKLPTPQGNPTLRTAIANFRRNLVKKVHGQKITGRAWGVKTLFNGLATAEDQLFSRFVVESAAIARAKSDIVSIFVAQRFGRNARKSGTPKSWLCEKTHWRLYAAVSGYAPFAIPCITCLRNIEVPWTTRLDLSLPDTGSYRYEPIPNWESGKVKCIETLRSKRVWLDVSGNGWARPSTNGEPEHWDVYIKDVQLLKKVNLDQINITRFGVRCEKNIPGEVHHVPENKKHAAKG
jgi:hypothetical protein